MTAYPAYTGTEPCTRRPVLFTGDDTSAQRVEAAKQHCTRCPLIVACAEYAIAHERHHVWAGMSPEDRDRIRKARGIVVQSPPVWPWASRGAAA